MKTIIRAMALGAILATIATGAVRAQFYYGAAGRVQLRIDSSRVLIKFGSGLNESDIGTVLAGLPTIGEKLDDSFVLDGFRVYRVKESLEWGSALALLHNTSGVDWVEPYYLDGSDSSFVIGATFIVAFDSTMTSEEVQSVAAGYGVKVDRELLGMHNVFLVRNTRASGRGLLDIANLFHELPVTRWAHPNFRPRVVKHTYKVWDDYYTLQNHIKKVIGRINEASVWDFAGLAESTDSVIVAVVDDGVTDHAFDLTSSKILPGFDFCTGDSASMRDADPSPGPWQAHGMGCAGIIVASHAIDSELAYYQHDGIIGMNPLVKVLPVKIFPDYDSGFSLTIADHADAVNWAWGNGAWILSNSWGWITTPVDTTGGVEALNEALLNAVVHGRDGKGCPVFFASGNSGLMNYPVGYPAYLPYVLAVGSVDTLDNLLDYTQRGDSLDLMAPSGATALYGNVWTIDQMYQYGVNPNYGQYDSKYPWPWGCQESDEGNNVDYNCRMGGTSAACPVVAGAASLLLARDPNLLARDTLSDSSSDYNVYDVLCKSAKPLGGAVPNGTYGWGRVDAFRAILSIARGDVNNDANVSLGDISLLIDHLFGSGAPIFPDTLLGDVNCDGQLSIGDVNLLVDHLFISLNPLPLPCFEFND